MPSYINTVNCSINTENHQNDETSNRVVFIFMMWLLLDLPSSHISSRVASIWLPTSRHLRIEESMEEVTREHHRIQELVGRLRVEVLLGFVTFHLHEL